MLVVDTVPDFYAKHKNRTFSAVRIKDTVFLEAGLQPTDYKFSTFCRPKLNWSITEA